MIDASVDDRADPQSDERTPAARAAGQLLLDLGPPPAPTFSNFLPGANDTALHALQQLIADQAAGRLPVAPFITLWGPRGSGKTHLLSAALAEGGHLLSPVSSRAAFEAAAHAVLVAADDVDRFNDWQQQVMFNLYNRCREQGRPCVLASLSAPVAQAVLREDLRTRLGWGLVFGLSPLTDEQAQAAVGKRVAERGLSIAPDVVPWLLNRFARDMGSL
ncbi:MAG TPA: DnaA/Hda family protein, partial [Burkholderiaceae bacterium]|nr:DnaA/Hda family protein [Burkholderiaceae bacterium]